MISAIFEITFMDGQKRRIEIPNCNMYPHKDSGRQHWTRP